jgi:alpha-ribazole phosphatase
MQVYEPMQVYLVRHPQPSDIGGLCYGRLDVAVEERVLIAAADSVSAHIPRQMLACARVYSSPASRCLGLARHLAAPREPTLAEDLAEMNFGDWEGLAWDAIPRDQMDAWSADVWGYQPGGGESANMVEIRWLRWLEHMRRTDVGAVIAVTHAGVIRVALAGLVHPRSSFAIMAHIPFGSVHRLNLAWKDPCTHE